MLDVAMDELISFPLCAIVWWQNGNFEMMLVELFSFFCWECRIAGRKAWSNESRKDNSSTKDRARFHQFHPQIYNNHPFCSANRAASIRFWALSFCMAVDR